MINERAHRPPSVSSGAAPHLFDLLQEPGVTPAEGACARPMDLSPPGPSAQASSSRARRPLSNALMPQMTLWVEHLCSYSATSRPSFLRVELLEADDRGRPIARE